MVVIKIMVLRKDCASIVTNAILVLTSVSKLRQRVEKVLHQAHQQREMQYTLTTEEAQPISKEKATLPKKDEQTSQKPPKKRHRGPPLGTGGVPILVS